MSRGSIRTKLMIVFISTSMISITVNIIMFFHINRVINQIDIVYISNINLNQLSDTLTEVQDHMYRYLNVKSSVILEDYYTSEQDLRSILSQIEVTISDKEEVMLETNIKNMCLSYLEVTKDVVKAKRGRNINQYNELYQEAEELFNYIHKHINRLNNIQLAANTGNYMLLRDALRYLEIISTVIFIMIMFCNFTMIVILTRTITKPIVSLARVADEVSAGNFLVHLPVIRTGDEVESLSKAFSQMILSIREYIERFKVKMIEENEMKEKELLMENHLKDAQLKYLQAQINPHFLFNTINAGISLAVIEEAEKTAVYFENMAEFFRYNITKINQETTIREELELVDHYIYILNVRFSGEINYKKRYNDTLLDRKVPPMILQPFVENAVQHGIRGLDREGKIEVTVYQNENSSTCISVWDNGIGISEEKMKEIMNGSYKQEEKRTNGVAIENVRSRLELYFEEKDMVEIFSIKNRTGTKILITLPQKKKNEGKGYV